jgi:hypothetical protein
MKKKFKIQGIFDFNDEWYANSHTGADYGEMHIEEYVINLRIGAVWYVIEEIRNIEKIFVGPLEMEPWIKIDYY